MVGSQVSGDGRGVTREEADALVHSGRRAAVKAHMHWEHRC